MALFLSGRGGRGGAGASSSSPWTKEDEEVERETLLRAHGGWQITADPESR